MTSDTIFCGTMKTQNKTTNKLRNVSQFTTCIYKLFLNWISYFDEQQESALRLAEEGLNFFIVQTIKKLSNKKSETEMYDRHLNKDQFDIG